MEKPAIYKIPAGQPPVNTDGYTINQTGRDMKPASYAVKCKASCPVCFGKTEIIVYGSKRACPRAQQRVDRFISDEPMAPQASDQKVIEARENEKEIAIVRLRGEIDTLNLAEKAALQKLDEEYATAHEVVEMALKRRDDAVESHLNDDTEASALENEVEILRQAANEKAEQARQLRDKAATTRLSVVPLADAQFSKALAAQENLSQQRTRLKAKWEDRRKGPAKRLEKLERRVGTKPVDATVVTDEERRQWEAEHQPDYRPPVNP